MLQYPKAPKRVLGFLGFGFGGEGLGDLTTRVQKPRERLYTLHVTCNEATAAAQAAEEVRIAQAPGGGGTVVSNQLITYSLLF